MALYIINLSLILIFIVIASIWKIGVIPPLSTDTSILDRLFTPFIGAITVIFTYISSYKISKNYKTALLSAAILSFTPWFLQELRIYSPPIFVTASILFIFVIFDMPLNFFLKTLFIFLSIFLSINRYPEIITILFSIPSNLDIKYLINAFSLLSFESLFFSSNNFWWGGIRDHGALLTIFLPFLVVGVLRLDTLKKKVVILIWFTFVLLISSANTKFPEGRYFFMLLPLFSLFIAHGIQTILSYKTVRLTLVIFIMTFIFTYSYIIFLHQYTHHYFLRISNDISKIHEKF